MEVVVVDVVVDVVVVDVVVDVDEVGGAKVEAASVVADSTPLREASASSSLLDSDAQPAIAIAATPIKTLHRAIAAPTARRAVSTRTAPKRDQGGQLPPSPRRPVGREVVTMPRTSSTR